MRAERSVVVGTAGHIDHGKSELVRALTGIDPDRLKEEKERGITIDLGYAHLLVGNVRLAFVDVPGHERFVKNMLAGACGIDLVLLAVAADESIMPQTREHFDICRLLGIRAGLIALTKADLVEPELLELVELELRELVQGSFLEGAPIVATSTRSGAGLELLKQRLAEAAGRLQQRDSSGPFRLPIDRAFTLRGFGTVVTGTVASGSLAAGAAVELLPAEVQAVARSLQAHGEAVPEVSAGQRAALNLAGVEVAQAGRGQVVTRPGSLKASRVLDLQLDLLPGARALRRRTRVRLHHQAAEVLARLYPLQHKELAAGQRGWVRAQLETELAALPGDRVIIRAYSPMHTIGGGIVVEADPPARQAPARRLLRLQQLASGAPDAALAALLEGAGARGMSPEELVRRTGWSREKLEQIGSQVGALRSSGKQARWLAAPAAAALEQRALEALSEFHGREPLLEGMPLEELRARALKGAAVETVALVLERLRHSGQIRAAGNTVARAEFRVELDAAGARQREQLLARLRAAGAQGLTGAELTPAAEPQQGVRLLHLLLREGTVAQAGEFYFHREVIEELRAGLRRLAQSQPNIGVADFKALGGISRRTAIPLLEYFDREGFTRRVGDARVLAQETR